MARRKAISQTKIPSCQLESTDKRKMSRGLDIRSTPIMSNALGAKLVWNLIKHPMTLWKQIIEVKISWLPENGSSIRYCDEPILGSKPLICSISRVLL